MQFLRKNFGTFFLESCKLKSFQQQIELYRTNRKFYNTLKIFHEISEIYEQKDNMKFFLFHEIFQNHFFFNITEKFRKTQLRKSSSDNPKYNFHMKRYC